MQNVTIKVDDKAHAFHERLELDIRINDDLILEAHARSLNFGDEDTGEVHNLEFGLRLPVATPNPTSDDSDVDGIPTSRSDATRRMGSVSVRSNVSMRNESVPRTWRVALQV